MDYYKREKEKKFKIRQKEKIERQDKRWARSVDLAPQFPFIFFSLLSLAPFLLFSHSPSTLAFVHVYSVCLLGWMRVSWWGNRSSRRWAQRRGAEGGGHPFSKPWLAIVLKQSVNMRGKACHTRPPRNRWVQHREGQGGERESCCPAEVSLIQSSLCTMLSVLRYPIH